MTICFENVGITVDGNDLFGPVRKTCRSKRLLVTGDTGSGKTVLARALAGERSSSEGLVYRGCVKLGTDVCDLSQERQSKFRVGYIPQVPSSFFIAQTCAQEIAVSAYCSSYTNADASALILSWYNESPLAERSLVAPLSLSGGQQRLLMIEAVLGTQPDHLVIDDIYASLDPIYRIRLSSLIDEWQSSDGNRCLIGFSSSSNYEGIKFDEHLYLSVQKQLRPSMKVPRHITGERVLEYVNVSAGPVVGGRPLIEGVNLSIEEGEFVGFVGKNGVGKSSLLRLLAQIDRPIFGDIKFHNMSIYDPAWRGAAGRILFMHQEPELAAPLLSIMFNKFDSLIDREISQHLLRFMKLKGSTDYWNLSAGERAIASLILHATKNPTVWILDETDARIEKSILLDIISYFRNENRLLSALIVSHDLIFLNEACDRIVYI